jgi:RNA polymerase sigma factor (sigma-70 family)
MNKPDRSIVFYTLPTAIESYPYLQWHEDLRLKRYLHGLIADKSTPIEIVSIAQILVVRLSKLPPQRQDYQLVDRHLSGCVTALLANILLAQQQGRWIKFDLFAKLQQQDPTIDLADVYGIGLGILCDSARFLHNFQPHIPDWYDSLRAFSYGKFRRSMVDRLRSQSGLETSFRTNLGLVVRASLKRANTALIEAGEGGERLAGLVLLYQCLQATVKAKQFDTKNPQPMHYDALLARYRERGGEAAFSIPDRDRLQQYLTAMGNALRNYLQPRTDSLDRSLGDADGTQTRTLGDLVASQMAEEPSQSEPDIDTQAIRQSVIDLLQQLSAPDNRILDLFFGLGMTQSQVGKELGCHQTTAMHRRNHILQTLAKTLDRQLFPEAQLTTDRLAGYVRYIICICQEYYHQ